MPPRRHLPVLAALLPALAGVAVAGPAPGQEAVSVPDTAPDRVPLHIVGEIPARLERLRRRDGGEVALTLYFGAVRQALDRGDVLQFVDPDTGRPLATAAVLQDTRIDAASGRAHVRAELAEPRVLDRLEELTRSRRSEPTLVTSGHDALLLAPFEPENGDDPANFVRVVDDAGNITIGRGVVSPHVGFEVRFNEPIAVGSLDTIDRVRLVSRHPQAVVPMRVSLQDADGTRLRFETPFGLPCTPELRRATLADPGDWQYRLEFAAGRNAVATGSGATLATPFELPIAIDPTAPDNVVRSRVFRAR